LIVGAALVATASPLLRHLERTASRVVPTASTTTLAPSEESTAGAVAAPPAVGAASDEQPTAGLIPIESGLPSSDLTFTHIMPCRIVDTRVAGGRMRPGETRYFAAAGSDLSIQGGSATGCNVIGNASAVVLNIVAVNPDAAGFLTVNAFYEPRPTASTLNYEAGGLIANEVIAGVDLKGDTYDFQVFSQQGVHLVVDVAGYFARPIKANPECRTHYGDWMTLAAGEYGSGTAACPSTDYAMVSGGCNWDHVNLQLIPYGQIAGRSDDQGGYVCSADNSTQSRVQFRAKVVCCRVPGR
jgi:hypothetical protein